MKESRSLSLAPFIFLALAVGCSSPDHRTDEGVGAAMDSTTPVGADYDLADLKAVLVVHDDQSEEWMIELPNGQQVPFDDSGIPTLEAALAQVAAAQTDSDATCTNRTADSPPNVPAGTKQCFPKTDGGIPVVHVCINGHAALAVW